MRHSKKKNIDHRRQMKPTGEEIANGFREWVKDEIKSSPSRSYELGKFFFGVSVATVGMLATIVKVIKPSAIDNYFKFSLLFFAISIIIALNMARPRNWKLGGKTNLFAEHQRIVNRGIRYTFVWFFSWFIGFVLGLYSILM